MVDDARAGYDEAFRAALAIEDGRVAVAEWEAEHGALTPQELAEADAALDRLGIPSAI